MAGSAISGGSSLLTGEIVLDADYLATISKAIAADLGTRYSITRYLGRGAFASVWHADDRASRCPVAVKQFLPRPKHSGDFYRELSVLFRLNHPSIVTLINILESSSRHQYLILEYCPGGTLRTALSRARRRGETCSIDWATSFARQMFDALATAHAEGIVHRDVKPENILFADAHPLPFSQTCSLKLGDFGLAKALDRIHTYEHGTRISGSPTYMAPEQFCGRYSAASDLYSLGVVLVELLTGNVPFQGTPEELAFQHLYKSQTYTNLPDPWPMWLSKLLAKDPSQRQTAQEWLSLLKQCTPTVTPLNKGIHMSTLSPQMTDALDRDLDRLHSSVASLGELKRGKRVLRQSSCPLEKHGFTIAVVHPTLDQKVLWDDSDNPLSLVSEHENSAVDFNPLFSSNSAESPSHSLPFFAEDIGTVDSVLSHFDWS